MRDARSPSLRLSDDEKEKVSALLFLIPRHGGKLERRRSHAVFPLLQPTRSYNRVHPRCPHGARTALTCRSLIHLANTFKDRHVPCGILCAGSRSRLRQVQIPTASRISQ